MLSVHFFTSVDMILRNIFSGLFVVVMSLTLQAQEQVPLIPKPVNATKISATFLLDQHTQIVAEEGAKPIAEYLQTEILKNKGISLRSADRAVANTIDLQLRPNRKQAIESYQLTIKENKIEIKAAHVKGLFAGVCSLMQLIRQQKTNGKTIGLAGWNIYDQPRYAWRGLMLDESRHFFGMQKVKQLLDWMAFYKLNKFHWHLTDQQGWRIEIKAYPKLTLIGGVGNQTDSLAKAQYYTQEEIKEIVRYAAERYIDVIPEIDMPGHATAANKAYPAFSGGGSEKYPEFTFNPAKETTYQYLTNILREVDVLLPSQMIHIGADEVHFGNQHWNKDEAVQQLMTTDHLKDLAAVETYFVKRMADSIKNLSNQVLAWDEVVNGTLSPQNTTVFWWRHDKPEILQQAIKAGFEVVLCPRLPLYFDFVQDSSHLIGRKWSGSFVPLQNVYHFPTKAITDLPNANSLIRGIQANIWTEAIADEQQLDFKLFPRIAALAEAAWTKNEQKDLPGFNKRLKGHLKIYTDGGISFFNPFNPENSPEPITPLQRNGLRTDHEAQTAQERGLIK